MAIGSIAPNWFFDPSEVQIIYPLKKYYGWVLQETGYLHLQATKPDTVGMFGKLFNNVHINYDFLSYWSNVVEVEVNKHVLIELKHYFDYCIFETNTSDIWYEILDTRNHT